MKTLDEGMPRHPQRPLLRGRRNGTPALPLLSSVLFLDHSPLRWHTGRFPRCPAAVVCFSFPRQCIATIVRSVVRGLQSIVIFCYCMHSTVGKCAAFLQASSSIFSCGMRNWTRGAQERRTMCKCCLRRFMMPSRCKHSATFSLSPAH